MLRENCSIDLCLGARRPGTRAPGGYLNGAYITNFDAYDPASNTWQTLAPLPEGKVGVQGGVIGNKVYVLGGNNNPTSNYIYDIDAGTWSTGAPLPVGNYYGSEVIYDDQIYVIGGWSSANFLRYDPAPQLAQRDRPAGFFLGTLAFPESSSLFTGSV